MQFCPMIYEVETAFMTLRFDSYTSAKTVVDMLYGQIKTANDNPAPSARRAA